ncbi:MAG TPA: glycosyltransferase [Thermomicrobiaceae bacterium]|nr:glycosyltransferase [Thermomicrobiaceae bacterium]
MPEPDLLTVVVLTLNEERHLPGCLASIAGLKAPVLVIDSDSGDATVDIALAAGAKVERHDFGGYASQRQLALDLVRTRWTLFLDADERLTPELSAEILDVLSSGDRFAGYWIPRANWFGSRRLRGGGWWPDRQLRLVQTRRSAMHPDREVHETIDLGGPSADLTHPFIHLNYDSLTEFRDKQRRYTCIRADNDIGRIARPPARRYVSAPVRELWRRFVQLHGYRDGALGFELASILAWYELRYWGRVAAQASSASDVTPARRLPGVRDTIDISVIIVSFNVREKLAACLQSIDAWKVSSRFHAEVIVVDNASTDGTAAYIAERFPAVELFVLESNRGFAAGCNAGLLQSRGHTLVLLNPDTEVIDDALDSLHGFLGSNPGVAIVGPKLIYPDGSIQPSRRRFPGLVTGLVESTIVQDIWHDNAILRDYYVTDRPDDMAQDVDWLVGACLAVRREAIDDAGLLDERFFMYSEEVEWCYRMKRAGWRIAFLPEATVIHHEGASSRQDVPRRQLDFDTSKVLLFRTLHGNLAAELLRVYLLGTYAVRILIEGSKGLLGHKREVRRARVALYARGLRSSLRQARR